jgi:anti-sigma-K factor RskA
MSEPMAPLDHAAVEELGPALALGALEPDELRAVIDHLDSCPEPHAELRSFLGAGDVLAASLEPVPPSAGLRDRLMGTVAATAQEHAAGASPAVTPVVSATDRTVEPRRRGVLDWFSPNLARGLALAAVVVAIVFGAWNISLQGQLSSRDQALRAVAQAIASGQTAFRVSGSGGSGYVVADKAGNASFVAANLAPLGANQLYELWLIGSDNKPVAVGTFTPSGNAVAVVPLERAISGFAVFAVTAEPHRVGAPTSQPVMTANLGS